jgi:putative photosynthetic complex assembly protein 2
MMTFGLPALFAVAIWWSATGLILFLNRLRPRSFPLSLLAATLLLVVAAFGLESSATDDSVAGAYLAFSWAVLVWGWLEMGFLMGFITGPRRHACADSCSGWPHFIHAIQAILYHELAIIAAAAGLWWLTTGGSNPFGLYTFLVLWGMRQSAKLNLFFGVPNLGEQFLPAHMQYLKGFFRKRRMNALFPFSITISTVITVVLVQHAIDPAATAADATGYSLLASLMGLAVLEHWFMVLPLPTEVLWRWSMRPTTLEERA